MKSQNDDIPEEVEVEEDLPPLPKRDFTLAEMAKYNGKDDKRILLGINGNVYDVTKGKRFYGPTGPYGLFAGRDASRCFATFSTDPTIVKDEYDDLSDLNSMQMESLSEWELQISEKYDHVGKLLKPDEAPNNYHMEESEDEVKSESDKKVEWVIFSYPSKSQWKETPNWEENNKSCFITEPVINNWLNSEYVLI